MLYLIIGNGGAGVRAAAAVRERDPEGEIVVVDPDPHPCYYRMRLPDYVCGWRERGTLFMVDEDFYRENRIRFLAGDRVVRVIPRQRRVQLEKGGGIGYDRLLIASGAAPRRLPVPGGDLDGVVYLRTLAQAEEIKERGKRSSHAVALGGGLLGVEMARAFNEMGLETVYLIREDRFWPQVLDTAGSALVEKALAEKGILLRKEEGIREILGEGGRVKAVVTSSGDVLEADMVGVAIGVVSNLDFLEGSGVETDRGVIVDDRLRSNFPEIYAAGDVAQAYDVAHGEHRVVTSWFNARRQGETAGVNMSGGDAPLGGVVPYNTIVIYGLPVASIGLVLPPEEAEEGGFEVLTGDYPKNGKYRKLVLKDGVLVGCNLIGDTREAGVMEKLIRRRVDLTPYRDRLFDPSFDLSSLL